MYVRMCVCMYVSACLSTRIYIHVHIHTYLYTVAVVDLCLRKEPSGALTGLLPLRGGSAPATGVCIEGPVRLPLWK